EPSAPPATTTTRSPGSAPSHPSRGERAVPGGLVGAVDRAPLHVLVHPGGPTLLDLHRPGANEAGLAALDELDEVHLRVLRGADRARDAPGCVRCRRCAAGPAASTRTGSGG